jgi:hypothetical protein
MTAKNERRHCKGKSEGRSRSLRDDSQKGKSEYKYRDNCKYRGPSLRSRMTAKNEQRHCKGKSEGRSRSLRDDSQKGKSENKCKCMCMCKCMCKCKCKYRDNCNCNTGVLRFAPG